MIATALIFLLGLLTALLLCLLVSPIFWRKAQTLARREYEATLPASANEIRAEFDMVRAEAALKVRAGEVAVTEMRARVATALADLGRAKGENADLAKRQRELEAEIERFVAERENLRRSFSAFEDKERQLTLSLSEAKRDGSLNAEELEALAQKFHEMADLAEERKVELVAAETRIERLTDTLRSVERASVEKDTLIRLLRAEAEERPAAATVGGSGSLKAGAIPGLQPARLPAQRQTTSVPAAASSESGPDAALSRARPEIGLGPSRGGDPAERIAEIAAHAILAVARREGEASPLNPLLTGEATEVGSAPKDYLSLADRVHRLAVSGGATTGGQTSPRRAE